MTKKIVGATYTVVKDIDEFPLNSKIVLIEDDDSDMPAFTLKSDYNPSKKFHEMDYRYVYVDYLSLDEDPQVDLGKPYEISVNGIKITIPSYTTSITINGKTNAIEISWEEF